MKTPYCAAVGLQRREVDEIRISISVEVSRLVAVEREQADLAQSVRQEREAAAEATVLPSAAYFAHMRALRTQLESDRQVIDGRVTQLQSAAREAYGSLTAVEGAAERFRGEARRRIETAEQSASDDRSAADFLRKLRYVRAATGRPAR